MSETRTDLRYSSDHQWVRVADGAHTVRVGISDFAQESLGDVIEVTLPRVGERIEAGVACGDVESTKSVSDLVAPVTGSVTARNETLGAQPEAINVQPYQDGWLYEVDLEPSTVEDQLAALMDAAGYRALIGE